MKLFQESRFKREQLFVVILLRKIKNDCFENCSQWLYDEEACLWFKTFFIWKTHDFSSIL